MSTRKQRLANKQNAKKSTGPKTEVGKQASSQNALEHGAYALQAVIPGEDAAAFDQLCCDFADRFDPGDPYERSLIRQMADAEWRLRRLTCFEADFLKAAVEDERKRHHAENPGQPEPDESLLRGRALQTGTLQLARLARCAADLGRRQRQAHKSLMDSRKQEPQAMERSSQPAPARNPRDHSQPREPFWHPTGDIRNQIGRSTERSQSRPTPAKSTASDPPDHFNSDDNAA